MPAGDAQKAWFPEMLEYLKAYWSTEWSWRGFSVFCEAMTEKRQKIMEARGIKPARMYCKECGSQMVLPPISIRSALFALRKIGALTIMNLKNMKRNGLNTEKPIPLIRMET